MAQRLRTLTALLVLSSNPSNHMVVHTICNGMKRKPSKKKPQEYLCMYVTQIQLYMYVTWI